MIQIKQAHGDTGCSGGIECCWKYQTKTTADEKWPHTWGGISFQKVKLAAKQNYLWMNGKNHAVIGSSAIAARLAYVDKKRRGQGELSFGD